MVRSSARDVDEFRDRCGEVFREKGGLFDLATPPTLSELTAVCYLCSLEWKLSHGDGSRESLCRCPINAFIPEVTSYCVIFNGKVVIMAVTAVYCATGIICRSLHTGMDTKILLHWS